VASRGGAARGVSELASRDEIKITTSLKEKRETVCPLFLLLAREARVRAAGVSFPRFIAAPSSSDLGRWRDRRSVLAWRASPRHTRGRAARPSRTGAFDSDCRRRTRATRADATGVSSTLASARVAL